MPDDDDNILLMPIKVTVTITDDNLLLYLKNQKSIKQLSINTKKEIQVL